MACVLLRLRTVVPQLDFSSSVSPIRYIGVPSLMSAESITHTCESEWHRANNYETTRFRWWRSGMRTSDAIDWDRISSGIIPIWPCLFFWPYTLHAT